jgi:hypothetical protein
VQSLFGGLVQFSLSVVGIFPPPLMAGATLPSIS